MSSGKSNNSFSCFMHERQLMSVYGRIVVIPLTCIIVSLWVQSHKSTKPAMKRGTDVVPLTFFTLFNFPKFGGKKVL
jgi:hypothetical protein